MLEVLAGNVRLRAVLGLAEQLPHYTPLQKFSARSQVLEITRAIIARIGAAALKNGGEQPSAARDSTGLATTGASAYFNRRRGKRCRG